MRNLTLCLLLVATSLAAHAQIAQVQSRFLGEEEAEQAFWSELYAGGGETLYCGESFADSEGLAISADRKSTRLNSSHVKISYAVFCLKKKKSANIKITSDHN